MFEDIYTRLLQEDGSPRLIQDVNHQIFTDLIVSLLIIISYFCSRRHSEYHCLISACTKLQYTVKLNIL